MSGKHVDATFYAQVEPEWSTYITSNGERALRGAKVVTITQKKPTRPKGGTVLVKLTIRVPESAFMPLRPEAPEDGANRRVEILLLTDSAETLYKELFGDSYGKVRFSESGAQYSGELSEES